MEQNLPVMSKKVWKLVRVIFTMLKKGIAKRKLLLLDLNFMMKRGKIAGKLFNNLLFHHHHHQNWAAAASTTTFHHHHHHRVASSSRIPALAAVDDDCDDDIIIDPTVLKVLDHMLTISTPPASSGLEIMSPTPTSVGQIMYSPFPVDEAADKFIRRFYNDRKREN